MLPASPGSRGHPAAARAGRGRRADARRNVEAILDAALVCLVHDPGASVGEIAQAAGVGRVTLYGHFKSRADLIDAVLARTLEHADTVFDEMDTSGEPLRRALRWPGW